MFSYWRDSPPTHVLVAAYLGLGRHNKPGQQSGSRDELMRAIEGIGK